jgi:hypothetical protein
MLFKTGHPLSDTHGICYVKDNRCCVPNFLGANLPRCDQGDRELYCLTMLVLFKPWRRGNDLKVEQTWNTAFQEFEFTQQERCYMCNFNVRYKCLDAHDDYRAQMKRGIPVTGSWDVDDGIEVDDGDDLQGTTSADVELDDLPFNPLVSGPIHKQCMQDMNNIEHMMSGMGWTDPLDCVQLSLLARHYFPAEEMLEICIEVCSNISLSNMKCIPA